MKTLLLMRHAKSDWSNADLGDRERPLNARGVKAAAAMARHIRANDLRPDLILCSPALRAEQTLAALFAELGSEPEVLHEEKLYLAGPATLLSLLRAHGGSAERVMVIGHNPGLQNFALDLVGKGKEEDWGELGIKFPTAALAVITFDIDSWAEAAPRRGSLASFVRPRQLV